MTDSNFQIIAVDNDSRELDKIRKAFDLLKTPCLPILYNEGDNIDEKYSNIRIAFFDINLGGLGNPADPLLCNIIASALKEILDKNNGPYALIFWSLHISKLPIIKKYIEVDEKEIDVRLTNKENDDGTNGAPALYANIPILNIKNDARKIGQKELEENKEKTAEIENNKQNEKEEKTDKKTESEKTTSNDHKTPKEMKEKNETKNLEDKKDFETQEKIKEIIDGVIEDAENNKEKAKNEEQ